MDDVGNKTRETTSPPIILVIAGYNRN
ncbi:uncharacterized protein G2W53_026330 [Senna tora]|uniref:Uncharacterized protein n=1 Tax=Senna tora TaxID=362788 RepID=A0A834TEN1_9FABA|nr:uncharacterized protein G2W53_026187 [Senna tora]KAF7820747.1 uncharacterized protein G2W53_026202 [Senna tora]KAF7820767.1 uncharacterized protein G2W53_026222 [Senna tora]KAF7820867.1 uncharacterized protein G2W53_026322 [Senna tora]KAF7820875.1 uncharacterized protein G2W53_026330 [Senna tora]